MHRIAAFLLIIFCSSACNILSGLGVEPSALETAVALRKVLDSSTFKTLKTLKQVNDEGIEGALPDELSTVLKGLRTLGVGGEVDAVTRQIEQATRVALVETEGTISDAIKTLRFKDAAAIALGGGDAATTVLREALYATVKQRYSQKIDAQLDRTEAKQYWPMAASAYNLFAKRKVQNDLSDYLAERAVDVVFLTIGKEERQTRANYRQMGDQLVNKVFDYYSAKKKRG